jgi:hypothetical protein
LQRCSILSPPLVHVSNLGVLERSSSSTTSTFLAMWIRQDHKSLLPRVRATSHHPSKESIDSLCLLALASHRRQTMTTTVRVPGRKSSAPGSSSSNDIDIGLEGRCRIGWEVPVCGFDNGYNPEVPGAYSVLPVNPEWDGRRVRRRSSSAESASTSTSSSSAELFYRTLPVAVLVEADEDDCDESCSQQSSCCDLEYEWELLRWTGAPGGGGRSAPVMLVVVSAAVLVVASDSSKCCCSCSYDASTAAAGSAYYYAPATLRQLVSDHVLRWKQGEIRAGRKLILLFAFRTAPPPTAASRTLLRAAAGFAMMRMIGRTDPTASPTDWKEEKETECESGPPCRGSTAQLPATACDGAEAEATPLMRLTSSRYLASNPILFTPFLGLIPALCSRSVLVSLPRRGLETFRRN